MDFTLKLWLVVVVIGALNYLSRLSFIVFFARRHVPPLLGRAFRYVPAAMLTALVLPAVVAAPGGALLPAAPKIVAAHRVISLAASLCGSASTTAKPRAADSA